MNEATCASGIRELRTAIATGAWPEALAHALAAWRAVRAPALADLVDAVAARCATPERPPHLRAVHAWWIELAATYDPVAVTALAEHASLEARGSPPWPQLRARYPSGHAVLAPLIIAYGESFATHLPTHMNLVDRLAAMASWPDDPRMAAPLCAWLVDGAVGWSFSRPPYGQAATVLYELVASALGRLADARILPALRACVAEPRGETAPLRRLQVGLAQRLIDGLAARRPLTEALAVAVAAVTAELPAPARPPRGGDPDAALWAAVLAAPADDAPRLVLADALTARGDPRGELIALQCHGRRKTLVREAKLVKAHWRDWVGALAPLLSRRNCAFERGMLVAIGVGTSQTPAGSYTGLRGHRELACVTTVRPVSVVAVDYVRVLDAFDRLDVAELSLNGLLAAMAAVRARWTLGTVELRESSPPLYERDPADVIRELVTLVPDVTRVHVEANLWTPLEQRRAWLDELARRAPRAHVQLRAGHAFQAYRERDGDDRLASIRGRPGLTLVEL